MCYSRTVPQSAISRLLSHRATHASIIKKPHTHTRKCVTNYRAHETSKYHAPSTTHSQLKIDSCSELLVAAAKIEISCEGSCLMFLDCDVYLATQSPARPCADGLLSATVRLIEEAQLARAHRAFKLLDMAYPSYC